MSYTSGRTVKSSKARKSPIAEATATGRRLAKRHLPESARPMVESVHCACSDGVVRMKTTITFAGVDRESSRALADAVTELSGYHSMCWNEVSISYLTTLREA